MTKIDVKDMQKAIALRNRESVSRAFQAIATSTGFSGAAIKAAFDLRDSPLDPEKDQQLTEQVIRSLEIIHAVTGEALAQFAKNNIRPVEDYLPGGRASQTATQKKGARVEVTKSGTGSNWIWSAYSEEGKRIGTGYSGTEAEAHADGMVALADADCKDPTGDE